MNNLEKLENTCCPCCGEKRLRLKETGDWWPEFPEYYVGCDNCDFNYNEGKSTDCGDALVMFFEHLDEVERTAKMVTKEQERKALDQIKKIVDSLGEYSYIAIAFEGCFEDAAINIENDWGCSWKQRAEQNDKYATQWEKECSERAREKEEALKKVEELQETIKKLSNKVLSDEDLTDFYTMVENDIFSTTDCVMQEADDIVKYAEDPNSDKFQNSVTCHRASTRRLEYLHSLKKRIEKCMNTEG